MKNQEQQQQQQQQNELQLKVYSSLSEDPTKMKKKTLSVLGFCCMRVLIENFKENAWKLESYV